MLIETTTRKIEFDEADGLHIAVIDTTHLADSDTGEIIHRAVKKHRALIRCGDDTQAASMGVKAITDIVWTEEARFKENEFQKAAKEKAAALTNKPEQQ